MKIDTDIDTGAHSIAQRLESLRQLSSRLSGIEDIVGERDQKFFKSVSQQEPMVSLEPEEAPKKRGLLDVVKGFLPRRKEKKVEAEETPAPKAPMKKVTPIQSKKKK